MEGDLDQFPAFLEVLPHQDDPRIPDHADPDPQEDPVREEQLMKLGGKGGKEASQGGEEATQDGRESG